MVKAPISIECDRFSSSHSSKTAGFIFSSRRYNCHVTTCQKEINNENWEVKRCMRFLKGGKCHKVYSSWKSNQISP